jgi:hypothetical protein
VKGIHDFKKAIEPTLVEGVQVLVVMVPGADTYLWSRYQEKPANEEGDAVYREEDGEVQKK